MNIGNHPETNFKQPERTYRIQAPMSTEYSWHYLTNWKYLAELKEHFPQDFNRLKPKIPIAVLVEQGLI